MTTKERIEEARNVSSQKYRELREAQEQAFEPTKQKLVQALRAEGFDDDILSMVYRVWYNNNGDPFVRILPPDGYRPVTITWLQSSRTWRVSGNEARPTEKEAKIVPEGKLLDAVIERMAVFEEDLPGYCDGVV